MQYDKKITREAIIEEIERRLSDRLGCEYDVDELRYRITESEKVDGSWFCNAWKAKEHIKANFDLFISFCGWSADNCEWIVNMQNIEREHCRFITTLLDEVIYVAFAEMPEPFKITKKFISRVTDALADLDIDKIFE